MDDPHGQVTSNANLSHADAHDDVELPLNIMSRIRSTQHVEYFPKNMHHAVIVAYISRKHVTSYNYLKIPMTLYPFI